jgi:hypothetical protein
MLPHASSEDIPPAIRVGAQLDAIERGAASLDRRRAVIPDKHRDASVAMRDPGPRIVCGSAHGRAPNPGS